MSQLLRTKKKNSMLFQDLIFQTKIPKVETLAHQAACYVCSKGLEDGYSVTAKTMPSRIVLFCDKHYPQN